MTRRFENAAQQQQERIGPHAPCRSGCTVRVAAERFRARLLGLISVYSVPVLLASMACAMGRTFAGAHGGPLGHPHKERRWQSQRRPIVTGHFMRSRCGSGGRHQRGRGVRPLVSTGRWCTGRPGASGVHPCTTSDTEQPTHEFPWFVMGRGRPSSLQQFAVRMSRAVSTLGRQHAFISCAHPMSPVLWTRSRQRARSSFACAPASTARNFEHDANSFGGCQGCSGFFVLSSGLGLPWPPHSPSGFLVCFFRCSHRFR